MSDPTNGKTDKERNRHNVKRPYNTVDIDWSKDAKGKPRTTHNNTQAMPCVAFAGGG